MKETVVTGLFTIIAAAVGGGISWLSAKSRDREKQMESEIVKLRSELLSVYKDALEIWKSEDNLIRLSGISKKEARKDRNISKRFEPARISQRIRELENKLS